jgi:hypothetical protein
MVRSLSQISESMGSCVRFASSLNEASKKLIMRFLSSCKESVEGRGERERGEEMRSEEVQRRRR